MLQIERKCFFLWKNCASCSSVTYSKEQNEEPFNEHCGGITATGMHLFYQWQMEIPNYQPQEAFMVILTGGYRHD